MRAPFLPMPAKRSCRSRGTSRICWSPTGAPTWSKLCRCKRSLAWFALAFSQLWSLWSTGSARTSGWNVPFWPAWPPSGLENRNGAKNSCEIVHLSVVKKGQTGWMFWKVWKRKVPIFLRRKCQVEIGDLKNYMLCKLYKQVIIRWGKKNWTCLFSKFAFSTVPSCEKDFRVGNLKEKKLASRSKSSRDFVKKLYIKRNKQKGWQNRGK